MELFSCFIQYLVDPWKSFLVVSCVSRFQGSRFLIKWWLNNSWLSKFKIFIFAQHRRNVFQQEITIEANTNVQQQQYLDTDQFGLCVQLVLFLWPQMATLFTGELVRQVDSEMPGTRMTMFIQGEQPKFLVSAKTGVSEWVCIALLVTFLSNSVNSRMG